MRQTRVLGIALALALSACTKPRSDEASQTEFFAGDNSTRNVVTAFLGSSDGIPGTLQDIPHMRQVFRSENGFNFEFAGGDGGFVNATTDTILKQVATAAGSMLQSDIAAYGKMQRGGTLFFYVTSHGAEDGTTSSADGQFNSAEILKAIASARTVDGKVVPLERLIMMFDTCFSGTNASQISNAGTSSGLPSANSQSAFINANMEVQEAGKQYSGIYKSLIFIAASKPNETSGDSESGGVGTTAFLQAVNDAKGKTATVQNILDGMRSNAQGQTPTWCVDPPEVLTDYFYDVPQGYLPVLYGDAAAEASRRKKCSQEL